MHGLLTAVILDSRNVFLTDDSRIIPVINMPPSDIPLTLKLPFFIAFSFSGSCLPVYQIILLSLSPLTETDQPPPILIRVHPTGK
jgi:hypothetical protein